MSAPLDTEKKYWYVLNFISRSGIPLLQKEIDRFNAERPRLELFAPVIRPAKIANGTVVYTDRLLTYYYVFVKGLLSDVKELCARPGNGLSLMIDRGSANRYGMLGDAEMENFRIIARAYANAIPFFNINDIDLEEGDSVEIVGGEFAGLKGTYIPKSRSTKGKLVIAATADLGTVLWDVDTKYVRILEFARDSRRQYDILDAFIPKLLPVMRKFHANKSLTDKEKSQLSVFSQRMGVVVPDNHKLEAKLLATLMCVNTIIGETEGYNESRSRFEKRITSVTNPWTQALIGLMTGVSQNDMALLKAAHDSVMNITDSPNKTQKELLEELEYYIRN